MNGETRQTDQVPLFLHIPKTAGTTLKTCVYEQYHSPGYYEEEDGFLVAGIYYYPTGFYSDQNLAVSREVRHALGREDLRAVVGHFSFGIHRYLNKRSTYVTLLRDPVARVLSLCFHMWHPEEFVTKLSCREAHNDQTRRIAGLEPHVGKCSDSTLDTAKDNLRRHFSVVGVTERFDESLVLMKRTLGWPSQPCYSPQLVNTQKLPNAALPHGTIDAIVERNALDIELYRFANELLNERISCLSDTFRAELNRFKVLNAEYAARERDLQHVPQAGETN